MKTKNAIAWFKTNFGPVVKNAVAGTPFSVDMLTAIAYQESGEVWPVLVDKQLSVPKILELCVGDTIDKGRTAFPRSKAELLAAPRGQEMFQIARQALVDLAQYISGYRAAARNPDKFCHGYGIFQYDLQFFRRDPDFFLQKKWCDIAACIDKFVVELREAMQRQGWANKSTLTDAEKVYVAIAYNCGHADPALGFKQGYQSDDGSYYGDNIAEYLAMAQSTAPETIELTTPSAPVVSPTSGISAMPERPHSLLKFGDDGDEVKVLQSLLQSQGYFSASLLGHFRDKTRQAVIYFQQTHLGPDGQPLEVDGKVGDNTWWALYHPSGAPQRSNIPAILPDGLTPIRTKTLEIAAAEHAAGVHEVPDGSNWGDGVIKYLDEAGSPANPWCCFFWSWCVHHALGEYPFGEPMGHVLTTWRRAKTKGWAMDKAGYVPVPGDAFVLLFKNDSGQLTGTGHIGFVLRVDRAQNATAFNTVEGNCGNRVKVGRRQMDQSSLVGFINQYPEDEQPTGWQTGLVTADDVAGAGTR